ncbi:hypothetical protein GCM10027418_02770 [Mariniluteicoccus endophyticus]
MRSANPILSRRDAFTPSGGGMPQGYPQFPGQPVDQGFQQPPVSREPQMTMDDVVTKTTVSLAVVVVAAAAVFFLVPVQMVMPVSIVSGLVAFVTSLVVALRRKVSPAAVLFFAAFEGAFVGGLSKVFEYLYPGIVVAAIFATFVAAAVTLGAYKFLNLRMGARLKKVTMIGTIAYAVVMLVNLGFALAGVDLGIRDTGSGASLLSMAVSAIAVVLCVLNLVMDFEYVEEGVRMGAPASQSWKAAMGLMATLVWMYVELLRILSYFRD